MKRYFVWKDANCNGKNVEWKEITGTEFYALKRAEPHRRFILWKNDDDPMDDGMLYEATEENYKEWDRERKRKEREDKYVEEHFTVFSIDDPVGTDDEEGLTWADIIPDTRDEDEELERQEEERRSVLVSKMLAEIEKLPEDDKNLIFAMFLNPEKNMSEKEYAELLGISQQNVNKRKLKIFKKIRAAMGVKK